MEIDLADNVSLESAIEAFYQQTTRDKLNTPSLAPERVHPILQGLVNCDQIDSSQVGKSICGRPIYQFRFGDGPLVILAWSQMHGDEPTATASLIDLMEFLTSEAGKQWQSGWQDNISLYLVPMLNPDGAAINNRQNHQGIDINRDARSLQSPEGRLLKELIDNLSPQIAFNLHDQNRYYTAGEQGPATVLAVMAPPPDSQKTLTPARQQAMALIGACVQKLAPHIQDKIARYDDTYSHRSFGDYAASQNIACILIESGTEPGDPNRQIARKMNFLSLVHVIDTLREEKLDTAKIDLHDKLPLNVEHGITDLLINNLTLCAERDYQLDVNIQIDRVAKTANIIELGDLYGLRGYVEFDASQYRVLDTAFFTLESPMHLDQPRYLELLRSGYIGFNGKLELLSNHSGWPVETDTSIAHDKARLVPEQGASFIFGKNNTPLFAVIKGIILDLSAGKALNSYSD